MEKINRGSGERGVFIAFRCLLSVNGSIDGCVECVNGRVDGSMECVNGSVDGSIECVNGSVTVGTIGGQQEGSQYSRTSDT